jgi:hypothetical protein
MQRTLLQDSEVVKKYKPGIEYYATAQIYAKNCIKKALQNSDKAQAMAFS